MSQQLNKIINDYIEYLKDIYSQFEDELTSPDRAFSCNLAISFTNWINEHSGFCFVKQHIKPPILSSDEYEKITDSYLENVFHNCHKDKNWWDGMKSLNDAIDILNRLLIKLDQPVAIQTPPKDAPSIPAGQQEEQTSPQAATTSKTKAKRIKGQVMYELDENGELKRAYFASDGKTQEIKFGDGQVDKAAKRLFVRAAGLKGCFDSQDVRDILDEMTPPLGDGSRDDVRDRMDFAICKAAGKTGQGRDKPKAFTLEKKQFVSDLIFKCKSEDTEQVDREKKLTEDEYRAEQSNQ